VGTHWEQPAGYDRTQPDTTQQPPPAYKQVRGCFHRWWQVQGSNLGRLSRRFYRPFALIRLYTSLPAHMWPTVIFAADPVRHMSVHAEARIAETTDMHDSVRAHCKFPARILPDLNSHTAATYPQRGGDNQCPLTRSTGLNRRQGSTAGRGASCGGHHGLAPWPVRHVTAS
jgi:hypothetical protein